LQALPEGTEPDNDYIRRGYTFAFLTRSLPTTKPNQQVYDPPSRNRAQLFISDTTNSCLEKNLQTDGQITKDWK